MNAIIRFYEELSLNAHPSLQAQYFDGWILRFANGYTQRANSVNILYPSILDSEMKIKVCEELYFSEKLPCIFKLTDGSEELDRILEARGYEISTPTYLMDADLKDRHFAAGNCVITGQADDAWLDTYFKIGRCSDEQKKSTAKQMLGAIRNKTLYCRLVKDDEDIACASSVLERGYAALLNVGVEEKYRGQGIGRQLCEGLLAGAAESGAHTAYLQVLQDNQRAIHLYEKMGFHTSYSYWYRVKKQKD